jgi:hypothetical protein
MGDDARAAQFEEFLAAELACLRRRLMARFKQGPLRNAGEPKEECSDDTGGAPGPQPEEGTASRACERWNILVTELLTAGSQGGDEAAVVASISRQPTVADLGASVIIGRGESRDEDDECEPHPDWMLPTTDKRDRESVVSTQSHPVGEMVSWQRDDLLSWADTSGSAILQKLVMHPSSPRRLLWISVGAVLLMYDLVFIPLQVSGLMGTPPRAVPICSVAYWTADVFVQMLTGYTHDLHTEMVPINIFWHYVRTWMAFDIGMVFIDIAFLIFDLSASTRSFRLIRLLRLRRMTQLRKWKDLADAKLMQSKSDYLELLFKVGGLTITIYLLCHYVACMWYGLAEATRSRHAESWVDKVGGQGGMNADEKLLYFYSLALHWSMTQFSPATNNIAPANVAERIFASGVVLMGMITFSSFLSSMASAINELKSFNAARNQERRKLIRFISGKRMSPSLSRKIISHFDQEANKAQSSLVEGDVPLLTQLPESVRVRLHQELYFKHLMANTILSHSSGISGRCFLAICHEAMSGERYTISEEVFMDGKYTESAYIITSGSFEYSTCASRHLRKLALANRAKLTRGESAVDPKVSAGSAASPSPSDSLRQSSTIKIGDWLSEGALWMEWQHLGLLAARSGGSIVRLDCSAARRIIRTSSNLHKCLRCCAVFFAHHLDLHGGIRSPEVTDLGLAEHTVQEIATRASRFY